jgi:pyruvate dehydrogenase E2 component (dihydrolipoamide acetyltransferase)
MPFEITIPRLGWSMEEGTFAGWQKKDGDRIYRGDILFELEGEKAIQEIEAIDDGVLRIRSDGPVPGAVLRVGSVVGYLLAPGEMSPDESGSASVEAAPSDDPGIVSDLPAAAPSVRR